MLRILAAALAALIVTAPAAAQTLLGVDATRTKAKSRPGLANPTADSRAGEKQKIVGEPVDITSGKLFRMDVDLDVAVPRMPLAITRYHDSFHRAPGAFGLGWTHLYARRLSIRPDSITVHGGDFRETRYTRRGDEVEAAERGEVARLEKTATGWRETVAGGPAFEYDERGRLTAARKNGAQLAFDYDGTGQLATIRDAAGGTTRIESRKGRILSIAGPDGKSWTYGYDTEGRLVSVRDPLGGERTYGYDARHRLIAIGSPLGKSVRLGYHPDGTLAWTQDARGARTTYMYRMAERTAVETDALGKKMTFAWDADGNVTSITDRLGHTTGYAYDEDKRLVRKVLPGGGEYTWSYSGGKLIRASDPNGATTTWEYDAAGRMIAKVDALGHRTEYGYDAAGRVAATKNPGGATERVEYGPLGLPVKVTDAGCGITAMEYDAAGHLVRTTDPMGRVTEYAYNARHMPEIVRFADGRVHRMAYDALDRPVKDEQPGKAVEERSYDLAGNLVATRVRGAEERTAWKDIAYAFKPVKIVSARGLASTMAYDAAGRLISNDIAGAGTWTYGYDAQGQLAWDRDPAGLTREYAYAKQGDLISTVRKDAKARVLEELDYALDAAGRVVGVKRGTHRVAWTRDALGRIVAEVDPSGAKSTFSYDLLGRLASTTDPAGATWKTEYDALGRPVAYTDPRGSVTRIAYNALGLATAYTDASGGVTALAYDPKSMRLVKVTDPLGRATEYAWDGAGLLARSVDPDQGKTLFERDAAGDLTALVDARGQRLEITRDPAGMPVRFAWPGEAISLVYDARGRTVKMENSVARIERSYGPTGLLVKQTVANLAAGTTYEFAWSRDVQGRPVKRTGPGAREAAYAYDADGRLASVTDGGETFVLAHDARDLLERIEMPGGIVQKRAYDASRRLKTLEARFGAQALIAQAKAYDPVGNLVEQVGPGAQQQAFTYDAMDRLVGAKGSDGVESWRYDALSNRVEERVGGRTIPFAYDAQGRLASAGLAAFGLDARGALASEETGKEKRKYEHDMLGRLTAVTRNGVRVEYFYAPDGTLAARRENGAVTAYVHDGANLIAEQHARGTREYVTGPKLDELLAVREGGASWYPVADQQKTVVGWIDARGRLASLVAYRPFGAPRVVGGEDAVASGLAMWTGRPFDKAAGLYQFRNRAYDPRLGRFSSADPKGFETGTNRYLLAMANPFSGVDPFGLETLTIIENMWWYEGFDYSDTIKKYKEKGWDVVVLYDVSKADVLKAAQNTDVLWLVNHGGVREADQQVGFVWNYWGFRQQLTADEVAKAMAGKKGPRTTVVTACQGAHNETMAKAFGGEYVGFANPVAMGNGVGYAKDVLDRIADGQDTASAFGSAPQPGFTSQGSPTMYTNDRRASE